MNGELRTRLSQFAAAVDRSRIPCTSRTKEGDAMAEEFLQFQAHRIEQIGQRAAMTIDELAAFSSNDIVASLEWLQELQAIQIERLQSTLAVSRQQSLISSSTNSNISGILPHRYGAGYGLSMARAPTAIASLTLDPLLETDNESDGETPKAETVSLKQPFMRDVNQKSHLEPTVAPIEEESSRDIYALNQHDHSYSVGNEFVDTFPLPQQGAPVSTLHHGAGGSHADESLFGTTESQSTSTRKEEEEQKQIHSQTELLPSRFSVDSGYSISIAGTDDQDGGLVRSMPIDDAGDTVRATSASSPAESTHDNTSIAAGMKEKAFHSIKPGHFDIVPVRHDEQPPVVHAFSGISSRQRPSNGSWLTPLVTTAQPAMNSNMLRVSNGDSIDCETSMLRSNDGDDRSVLTTDTPALDRYQLAKDDTSPYGFVVLPNPRRQNKRNAGMNAIYEKLPHPQQLESSTSIPQNERTAPPADATSRLMTNTGLAHHSSNGAPLGEVALESANADSSHRRENVPPNQADSIETPKSKPIRLITQAEYDVAPRLIQIQTSLTELVEAISVLNEFLEPSSSWKSKSDALSYMTNSEVHRILSDAFPLERKRKNLLYALCYSQRIRMRLPSSANEEVTYEIVNRTDSSS